MLYALQSVAGPTHMVSVYDRIGELPVFSPDLESEPPLEVAALAEAIADADGLILASPEYIRSIPGGLKNAIDWLVSRHEVIGKPIVLAHASHRGDDMLRQLRVVLATLSDRFNEDLFLRIPLMKLSPNEISEQLSEPRHQNEMRQFLDAFASYCEAA
ncbi:oxidoreductase [Rhizobium sp. Pop5]|nr:oxidoreductase [Rhizobium sp. Pop5]